MAPFRDLAHQIDLTPYRIAKNMGVSEAQVKVLLGKPKRCKKCRAGYRVQQTCEYSTGVRLCFAMGLDPHRVGV